MRAAPGAPQGSCSNQPNSSFREQSMRFRIRFNVADSMAVVVLAASIATLITLIHHYRA
ncbi:hypothetical protein GCM10010388_72010 [Streptomyces mauvecolor]